MICKCLLRLLLELPPKCRKARMPCGFKRRLMAAMWKGRTCRKAQSAGANAPVYSWDRAIAVCGYSTAAMSRRAAGRPASAAAHAALGAQSRLFAAHCIAVRACTCAISAVLSPHITSLCGHAHAPYTPLSRRISACTCPPLGVGNVRAAHCAVGAASACYAQGAHKIQFSVGKAGGMCYNHITYCDAEVK